MVPLVPMAMPMVPLALPMAPNEPLAPNDTIGKITNGAFVRTPNRAKITVDTACVRDSPNGAIGNFTNGNIGSQWYYW